MRTATGTAGLVGAPWGSPPRVVAGQARNSDSRPGWPRHRGQAADLRERDRTLVRIVPVTCGDACVRIITLTCGDACSDCAPVCGCCLRRCGGVRGVAVRVAGVRIVALACGVAGVGQVCDWRAVRGGRAGWRRGLACAALRATLRAWRGAGCDHPRRARTPGVGWRGCAWVACRGGVRLAAPARPGMRGAAGHAAGLARGQVISPRLGLGGWRRGLWRAGAGCLAGARVTVACAPLTRPRPAQPQPAR